MSSLSARLSVSKVSSERMCLKGGGSGQQMGQILKKTEAGRLFFTHIVLDFGYFLQDAVIFLLPYSSRT